MDLLETFDPDAAASLQRVSGLSHAAFLELLALEGAAGCSTRQEYEALAVRRLLVEAVAWQADALAAGFWSVLAPQELRRWEGRGGEGFVSLAWRLYQPGCYCCQPLLSREGCVF
jgi:hypothetical protein